MALTDEQVKELKKQLSEQIKDLPPGQKEQAQGQINSMSAEALEEMLKQQQAQQGQQGGGSQKGIFRMIVDGDIPSKKIDENNDVIAVVSKRALSKGQVLIIPKKVVGDAKGLPSSIFVIAKKIAKKMLSKLGAENADIQTTSAFGEMVVNVIPVYDKPIDASQNYEVSEKELGEIYDKLRVVKKKKVIRIKKPLVRKEKIVKLKRRIP